jgi:hypothetical protein
VWFLLGFYTRAVRRRAGAAARQSRGGGEGEQEQPRRFGHDGDGPAQEDGVHSISVGAGVIAAVVEVDAERGGRGEVLERCAGEVHRRAGEELAGARDGIERGDEAVDAGAHEEGDRAERRRAGIGGVVQAAHVELIAGLGCLR